MAIILDTDVIIRGEKGTFDLRGWLTLHATEEIEIAAITVAELWHGVERASAEHRSRRQTYLETVFTFLPVIAYTDEIAREHARIWAEAESAGKMTGYYDLIVAATARHRGSQLATFNRRHFEHIRGLSRDTVSWWGLQQTERLREIGSWLLARRFLRCLRRR